ncbi:helix-turn-helix transcriptional regulator [Synergistaceae bacterium OttesenSCG-928-I11]|nr:helix-turn-helix transcriptional regulator [Synergistaceae bacterium OttesenSCG-928-I11]
MKGYEGKISNIADTPFGYTLSLIGGKWKMVIMYCLIERGVVRYNELQRMIGTITYKTLSTQLKELEADGIVTRTEYPQIPPKVEYSLSENGKSLIPILEAMCEWGEKNARSKGRKSS